MGNIIDTARSVFTDKLTSAEHVALKRCIAAGCDRAFDDESCDQSDDDSRDKLIAALDDYLRAEYEYQEAEQRKIETAKAQSTAEDAYENAHREVMRANHEYVMQHHGGRCPQDFAKWFQCLETANNAYESANNVLKEATAAADKCRRAVNPKHKVRKQKFNTMVRIRIAMGVLTDLDTPADDSLTG